MKNIIIGDIQGCFYSLKDLLEKSGFNPADDKLWLLGDLVNRGKHSLEVLRFLSQLPHCEAVLGNHDLHLLAVDLGIRELRSDDTLGEILSSPDKSVLLDWLAKWPFYLTLPKSHIILIHAGIPPAYDYSHLTEMLDEVHQSLVNDRYASLQQLFDPDPDQKFWLANAVTRIRFCTPDRSLEEGFKGTLSAGKQKGLIPWFDCLEDSWKNKKIVFGHWASLEGKLKSSQCLALDTGCVWGNHLSAYCVEEDTVLTVKANKYDLRD